MIPNITKPSNIVGNFRSHREEPICPFMRWEGVSLKRARKECYNQRWKLCGVCVITQEAWQGVYHQEHR